MRNITSRLKNLEKIVESSALTWDLIIVAPGETESQAIARAGSEEVRFRLIINTHPQDEPTNNIDAEIERTIRELKRKGVSDEEIRAITEA